MSTPPGWSDQPSPPSFPPRRPGTVIAAAVILYIGAGFAGLGCCGVIYLGGDADLLSERAVLPIAALLGLAAVLNLWLAFYLMRGRHWARVTAIVFCAIVVAAGLVSLLLAGGQDNISSCVGVAMNGAVIALLSGPAARDYFRAHHDRD